jgi:monoamine oxidase
MRSLYARLHRRFGRRLSGLERQRKMRDAIDHSKKRHPIRTPTMRPDTTDVIVVGGGFAGLAAAYEIRSDLGVLVLEASAQPGGRVRSLTDFVPGRIIEGGAELIGFNHGNWLRYASVFGLGLSVITSEDQFEGLKQDVPLVIGGQRLDPETAAEVYHSMTEVLKHISEDAKAIVDPLEPWTTPGASARDATNLSDKLDEYCHDKPRPELTRLALEQEFSADNTVRTLDQSYLGTLAVVAGGNDPEHFWDLVEVVRCETGNQSLATKLRDDFVTLGGQYRPSTRATHITIDEGHGVVVRDSAGGEHRGRYVVLAVPPTVWNQIQINPAIPAEYVVQSGPAVKYLTPLNSRFWIENEQAPASSSNRYGQTWEGTDNQMQLGDQGLDLSLFAGGPIAQAALDAPNVDTFYRTRLSEVYPGYADAIAAQPRFMAWPREPYIRTGYSCPRPGADDTGDIMRAGEALNSAFRGQLYFAGEHTCFAFFGFMEGALESGMRVSRQINADHAQACAPAQTHEHAKARQ